MAENFKQVIAEFASPASPEVPKYARLKNAILSAIQNGHLRPGDQLPPEQEIAREIGLSLGTVQRALNNLAGDSAVVREHGRGTFVSAPKLSVDELWQYRFVDRPGAPPLPISVKLLGRRIVQDRQPWSDALGFDQDGYCELTRLVIVNGDLRCLSRLYVRNSRFPTLRKMPEATIPANLKRFLAQKLKAPTFSLEQYMRPCEFDKEACALLQIKRGDGMVLHTTGRSAGQEAITYQLLWIPKTTYLLDMSPSGRPAYFGTSEAV